MSAPTHHQAAAPVPRLQIADGPQPLGSAQALTALALGLSYAGLTDERLADDLARQHAPELLWEARQRLGAPTELPRQIERRAEQLLEHALARAQSLRAGSTVWMPSTAATEQLWRNGAYPGRRSTDGD